MSTKTTNENLVNNSNQPHGNEFHKELVMEKNSKSRIKFSEKSNCNLPWSTNQLIYDLDIKNLTKYQKKLLIKQSKRNLENSFFQPDVKEVWNRILDNNGFLRWSTLGVYTQQRWVSFKYQMNLQKFILLTKEELNNFGWDEEQIIIFLGVFCGKEIGIEFMNQQYRFELERLSSKR